MKTLNIIFTLSAFIRKERNLQILFAGISIVWIIFALFYLNLEFKYIIFITCAIPFIYFSLLSTMFIITFMIIYDFNNLVFVNMLGFRSINIPGFPISIAKFLGLLLIISFAFNYLIKKKKIDLGTPQIRYGFILFLLALVISSLMSYFVLPSLNAVSRTFQLVVFYFILINVVNSKERLLIIIISIIIFDIVNSFMVLTQYKIGLFRVLGLSRNPTALAMIATYSMIFGVMFFLKTKKYSYKIFFVLLIISSIIKVVLTQSRAGFVSLLLVIGSYIIFSKNKILLMFLIIILISSILYIVPDIYFTRINRFIETVKGYLFEGEEVQDIRRSIYSIAMKVFKKHPVFGIGPANFMSYIKHIRPELWTLKFKVLAVHSLYISLLVESGIIGLSLFVMILLFILYYLIKSIKMSRKHKDQDLIYLTIAFFIGFINFLFLGFISASLLNRFTIFLLASGHIIYILNESVKLKRNCN